MHIYGPSQLHGPQAISCAARRPAGSAHDPARGRADHRRSQHFRGRSARRAGSAASRHPADRVEAVRQQIAAGTYETGDKLNAAVERLLDEIG